MPRILFTSLLSQRQWLICLLILALLIPFWPILQGKFYTVGDMRDVYIPLELFYQQESRVGRIPAWNPDVAWGYPVLAGGQIGFYYPPLLVGRLLLPIFVYVPIVVVAHVLAMGIGMFMLLRKLFSILTSAAVFGSLAFALSASVWQHTTHLNIFLAVAWLPWQLLLMHVLAAKREFTYRNFALAILTLGTPLLIGQFQIPILLAAVSAIYFLHQKYVAGQTGSGVKIIIGVTLGAILLTAAQLLPTAELFQFSSRNSSEGFNIERANQHSYAPYHLPALIFPRFYGNDDTYWGRRLEIEQGFYIGVIPLLVAIWAIWTTRRDVAYRFWRWLAGISFLLALGSLSPFRIIGFEPSLWVFSAPSRWLVFTTLALSVFAAVGFARMSKNKASLRRWLLWTAVIIGLTVLAGNGALYAATVYPDSLFSAIHSVVPASYLQEPTSYYIDKLGSLIQSARISSVSFASPYTWLALVLLFTAPFLTKHRKVLLSITAVELAVIAATTTPVQPWKTILEPPATVEALPQAITSREARIYSIREGGDTGAWFTDPSSRANQGTRELQRQLLSPMMHAQFGVAGVEWPASLDVQAHAEALEELRGSAGYAIENLTVAKELNIGAVLVPVGIDEMSGEPDRIVNDIAIYSLPNSPRAEAAGGQAVNYIPIAPNRIQLHRNTTESTSVVVRDTWYPGWVALSGGETVDVLLGERFFRSIRFPAGQNVIEMTYRPISVYAGLGISIMTGTVLLVFLIPRPKRR